MDEDDNVEDNGSDDNGHSQNTTQQASYQDHQTPKRTASFLGGKRKKKKTEDELMTETTNALRPAAAVPAPKSPSNEVLDEFDIFGKYVANEMRLIKDFMPRQQAKLKIQLALLEAQFHNTQHQVFYTNHLSSMISHQQATVCSQLSAQSTGKMDPQTPFFSQVSSQGAAASSSCSHRFSGLLTASPPLPSQNRCEDREVTSPPCASSPFPQSSTTGIMPSEYQS